MERRPHVRHMLSRCEWKPREIDEEMSKEVTRDHLKLWLSKTIRNPAAPIRERLSAARQLSNLNGWLDPKNRKPDEKSIIAEMMKAIGGSRKDLPERCS